MPDTAPVKYSRLLRLLALILALAAVGLAVWTRWRLLAMPLERDEGEYAYAGWLITQGVTPFAEAFNMKFPGLYYLNALFFLIFGPSVQTVKFALLLANTASCLLLFFIGRRLAPTSLGTLGGSVAAALYAVLSLTPGVEGTAANIEQFLNLFVLGGVLCFLRYADRRHWLLLAAAGLCFGLALLMKQHAALFCLLPLFWLAVLERRDKPLRLRGSLQRFGLLAGAMALPLAVAGVAIALGGAWGAFVFWTLRYAAEYAAQVPWEGGVFLLKSNGSYLLQNTLLWPWFVGLGGLVCLLTDPGLRGARVCVLPLAVAGVLAVCPGLYFRPHYFLLCIPALCLLGAFAAVSAATLLRRVAASAALLVPLLLLASLAATVHKNRAVFFELAPDELVNHLYAGNPFLESVPLAAILRQVSTPDERIAVIGSEPQIYFYAQRRGVIGYLYTYPLVEEHPFALAMQRDLAQRVEQSHPRHLVFVANPLSWLLRGAQEPPLFAWMRDFVAKHYRLIAVDGELLQQPPDEEKLQRASLLLFERLPES